MRARAAPQLLAAGAGAALALTAAATILGVRDADGGRSAAVQGPPGVAATFAQRSYAPGAPAQLVLWSAVREVRVQLFQAGLEPVHARARRDDELRGAPMADPRRFVWSRARRGARIRLTLGRWPSGLYFARLTSGNRVGYAPFVIRPAELGEYRVAVIHPTYTWQAYNFRDVDRDGVGDTWYAAQRVHSGGSTAPS